MRLVTLDNALKHFYAAKLNVVGGVRLTEECRDKHKHCGASPGWPSSWCDSSHQYVLDNCPKLCNLCREQTLCYIFKTVSHIHLHKTTRIVNFELLVTYDIGIAALVFILTYVQQRTDIVRVYFSILINKQKQSIIQIIIY